MTTIHDVNPFPLAADVIDAALWTTDEYVSQGDADWSVLTKAVDALRAARAADTPKDGHTHGEFCAIDRCTLPPRGPWLRPLPDTPTEEGQDDE